MKLHVVSNYFLAFILISVASLSSASAQNLCVVSSKRTSLAMDQRDDVRMKCMKTNKAKLSTKSCLQVANSMEYSNNAEDARLICLYELKKQPRLSECLAIAENMEYPDSGDEARWECIRRFNRVISKKECRKVAQKMSYPGNSRRATMYCSEELLAK
ncbi:hypothetical protein AZI86_03205 [Bdellovibrio bacteriovorus]|uniref:Uncharacterized protein n=1 Tax=Bdellovibrio bacteriovorus TaxID=959 RepID=A0A150WNW4_BDEBC|nr:hypothetical protein [Bdellovibrio bacteriovorus]KYG66088.1 hypothetical protein AZI86_03205 [Bdellovibrio bacteriovorus]